MLAGLFNFRGRIGRLAYLGVGAVQLACLILGFALMAALAKISVAAGLAMLLPGIAALAWIGLAATVKRLRDMGWPLVLGLIGVMFLPFVSVLLLFWPGQPGGGPDVSVFSDDPKPSDRTTDRKGDRPDWFERALGQVSAKAAPSPQPAAPIVQHAYAPQPQAFAPNGARTTFGLRR